VQDVEDPSLGIRVDESPLAASDSTMMGGGGGEGKGDGLRKEVEMTPRNSSPSSTSRPVPIAMDDNQLLLKGSVLRSVQFAVGITIYTGKDTKIQLNSEKVRSKMSTLEKRLNVVIITLTIINVVLCIVHGVVEYFVEVQGCCYLLLLSFFIFLFFFFIIIFFFFLFSFIIIIHFSFFFFFIIIIYFFFIFIYIIIIYFSLEIDCVVVSLPFLEPAPQ
jgi:hypothetical protein